MVSLSNHAVISLLKETPLPSRDCHPRIKCGVAMTVRVKLGTHESLTLPIFIRHLVGVPVCGAHW